MYGTAAATYSSTTINTVDNSLDVVVRSYQVTKLCFVAVPVYTWQHQQLHIAVVL